MCIICDISEESERGEILGEGFIMLRCIPQKTVTFTCSEQNVQQGQGGKKTQQTLERKLLALLTDFNAIMLTHAMFFTDKQHRNTCTIPTF